MNLHDDSRLTTERVASGRRQPLAVVLVALALVMVLVWKPWDRPTSASPSTTHVAFSTDPTPSSPPQPTPTVQPAPTPTAVPTPEIETVNVHWIVPFVRCSYASGLHGQRLLSHITLFPPLIAPTPFVSDGVDVGVKWHAVIESNLEQTLFTAPWDRVTASRRRPVFAYLAVDEAIRPIRIAYANRPVGPTIVVRVAVTVEWFDPDNQLIRTETVVPTSYRHGAAGAILPEGCHTII